MESTAMTRREKMTKSLANLKFMENFDPETSAREKRKTSRKIYRSQYLYDERGRLSATGEDLCDCLNSTCPGCHFPCEKCRSNKCGHECRVNRKWSYDKIEIEGDNYNLQNKNK